MARPLTPETRLKHRVRDLERMVDSWPVAAQHLEIWHYLEQLTALSHAAHHGIRRPDDLGGTISGNHLGSKAPMYDVLAMAQLKTELAHLHQRSRVIETLLNAIDSTIAQTNGHRPS